MLEALREAEQALAEKEVPIGAVVVAQNRIVGRGHNRVEALQDATAHAEMLAITAASNTVASWRLDDLFLYVTLEPCVMCTGAMMNVHISCLIYGASDPIAGACGSVYSLLTDPKARFHVDVVAGVLAERCSSILQTFFQSKR